MNKFQIWSQYIRYYNSKGKLEKPPPIVCVRHRESLWTEKNLFCGWYNSPLSKRGEKEAFQSGLGLTNTGYKFDIAYASVLQRTNQTLAMILKLTLQDNLKICKTWRLNERHYGYLTGMNKVEVAKKYGEGQVQIWRRSFSIPPPPITWKHPYYNTIRMDPKYKDEPDACDFPDTESLEMTSKRTLPYWNSVIVPQIKQGKRVLIIGHGSTLRAILKHLYNMSEDTISEVNIPSGIPFEIELEKDYKAKKRMNYLSDSETVQKAIEEIAAQAKIK